MTPSAFLADLAHELRQWVADCWPLIADDPCPGRWAAAWLEQQPVGVRGAGE